MKRSADEGGDERYLAWIRELPCCAPSVTQCESPPPQHPHHSTGAGMGLKSSDRETMPLCWRHHRHFHDGTGPFAYWTREDRRMWQEVQAERCSRAYDLERGRLEDGNP